MNVYQIDLHYYVQQEQIVRIFTYVNAEGSITYQIIYISYDERIN